MERICLDLCTGSDRWGTITGVTAGSGLTGGGSSGSVTLNVGAGTGIGVADDTVSVNLPEAVQRPPYRGVTMVILVRPGRSSASYGLQVNNTGTGRGIEAISSGAMGVRGESTPPVGVG